MAYAVGWLAEWTGHPPDALPAGLPAGAEDKLAPYLDLLRAGWTPTGAGSPLLSILMRSFLDISASEPVFRVTTGLEGTSRATWGFSFRGHRKPGKGASPPGTGSRRT